MAVSLPALRSGRTLLATNIFFYFWYSFLLEAELTLGPSAAEKIRYKKNSFTSLGLDPATFRLAAYCLKHYAAACSIQVPVESRIKLAMLISDVYISTWRWSYDRNM
jgi:hypothetical protein